MPRDRLVVSEKDWGGPVARLLSFSLDGAGLYVHLRLPDGTDTEFTTPLAAPLANEVNSLVAHCLADYIAGAQQTTIAVHEVEPLDDEA